MSIRVHPCLNHPFPHCLPAARASRASDAHRPRRPRCVGGSPRARYFPVAPAAALRSPRPTPAAAAMSARRLPRPHRARARAAPIPPALPPLQKSRPRSRGRKNPPRAIATISQTLCHPRAAPATWPNPPRPSGESHARARKSPTPQIPETTHPLSANPAGARRSAPPAFSIARPALPPSPGPHPPAAHLSTDPPAPVCIRIAPFGARPPANTRPHPPDSRSAAPALPSPQSQTHSPTPNSPPTPSTADAALSPPVSSANPCPLRSPLLGPCSLVLGPWSFSRYPHSKKSRPSAYPRSTNRARL